LILLLLIQGKKRPDQEQEHELPLVFALPGREFISFPASGSRNIKGRDVKFGVVYRVKWAILATYEGS
jgi:hypothetical protein